MVRKLTPAERRKMAAKCEGLVMPGTKQKEALPPSKIVDIAARPAKKTRGEGSSNPQVAEHISPQPAGDIPQEVPVGVAPLLSRPHQMLIVV